MAAREARAGPQNDGRRQQVVATRPADPATQYHGHVQLVAGSQFHFTVIHSEDCSRKDFTAPLGESGAIPTPVQSPSSRKASNEDDRESAVSVAKFPQEIVSPPVGITRSTSHDRLAIRSTGLRSLSRLPCAFSSASWVRDASSSPRRCPGSRYGQLPRSKSQNIIPSRPPQTGLPAIVEEDIDTDELDTYLKEFIRK